MINVFIIEDNPNTLVLLEAIVTSNEQLRLIGSSGTGKEGIKRVTETLPDIVVVDISLPDISGVECVKVLKAEFPLMLFMICTVHDEEENIFESLKAGASSYILKKSSPGQIQSAIIELYEGGAPMSSDIARKIVENIYSQENKTKQAINEYKISKREKVILETLAEGLTYQEVADKLFISIKTLRKHIYNIYSKMHVDNKTEALNKFFGKGR